MKNHAIRILFLVTKTRLNSKGKSVIKCRITYNKIRKEFSTGQFVRPSNWDSKSQFVKRQEPDADIINTQLNLIKTKITKIFLLLQIQGNNFTAEDIYKIFKGRKTKNEYNTIEFFNSYLEKLKTLVGIDIKQATWNKFHYIKNDLKSFINSKFKVNDHALRHLELQFINDFEYFLKTEKKQKQITINKSLQRFRKVIKTAVAENYLDKDPFAMYKTKTVRIKVVFLTGEELELLEQYEFSQSRLRYIKDLFVFCCYTGLPYNELMNLKRPHIIKGFDGNLWIKMKREKTSKELSIPLLPKALSVLDNYNVEDFIFPKISNQKYNSYLKEIAAIVGIDKNLTTHMARRTFASTVLLYNDVPMEIVSELLGHSSMKITQESYGKVVQKKISIEMNRLKGSV